MDPFSLHGLTTPLQIVLVDLMLGADNALMIGLASRGLPAAQRVRATALGIAAAVVLRLLMSVVATSLLTFPLVKLVGALVLMLIALNLTIDEDAEPEAATTAAGANSRMWQAAAIIVVADATMSLDNVVALAAIAQGSYLWLFIGVALSLPLLGYGGVLAAEWLNRAPGLVALGAALLGWIAGGMAVSDALWSHWVETNAPGLAAFAPLMCGAFVYLFQRFVPQPKRATHSEAPAPRVAPAPRLREQAAPRAEVNETRPPPAAKPAASNGFQERAVIAGILLLALIAGAFLAFITIYGGLDVE